MSNLERKLVTGGLPPRPNSGSGSRSPLLPLTPSPKRGRQRDYTPVGWDPYYDEKNDVVVDDRNTFRVYRSGTEGPVCFFLHGGGFSALSWACLSKTLSGFVTCRCVAMDFRGHGHSSNEDEETLSAEVLATDVGNVIQKLYGDDPPPIILIGHSLGGAIAVHTASRGLIPSLIGLSVIDVVEGTALDSLSTMQSFLRGRPQSFNTLDRAIEWCVRTNQIRNLESAKVSMAGQLKKKGGTTSINATPNIPEELITNIQMIQEEDEDGPSTCVRATHSPQPQGEYTWRIDLSHTEKYWKGWFQGLSSTFLEVAVPKMLLLAGIDRLDKELIVGQMQGKFQMQVLPQCGHAVHEDVPDKVAEVLATFMIRHKVAVPKDNFSVSHR